MSEKLYDYHDILVQWLKWWNGPGRHAYTGFVLPPLTRSQVIMHCDICKGIDLGGLRCQVCGRS